MTKADLKITNLTVMINSKIIIGQMNLSVPFGQKIAVFGENGAGKTTLLKALMGIGVAQVTGSINLGNQELINVSIDQRVKAGLGMFYQDPPILKNVKLSSLAQKLPNSLPTNLHIEKFLERGINLGLSGGEKKCSELAQVMALKPQIWLIDELDSGVDQENIRLMGQTLKTVLTNQSALIISHSGKIFDYLTIDRAIVLKDGQIIADDSFNQIQEAIKQNGYQQF